MDTAPTPRVFRNRWDQLAVPDLGQWRPNRSVSVVIPAYNCQRTLDLTLASLSVQTYPDELLEVVVVDDSSDPPIELPKIAPERCRVVRVADHAKGWGRANALHVGATQATGEILHWLDADMVVFPGHVEAQARWHHLVPDAVTLGYKRFVHEGWTTPEEVAERGRARTLHRLFTDDQVEPHGYVEDLIDETRQLRAGDHLNFRAHVGATAALRRDFYLAVGGFDTGLRLGEDTEFGFRLAQAGALFIPEPAAGSWHMGPSHMMTTGEALRRHNRPYLAQRMPLPRWLRDAGGRTWPVPLVTTVVEVGDVGFELVRTCVDRILASDEQDLRVVLVGDWDTLVDERRSVLDDPRLDLRLIEAWYRGDPRVDLAAGPPENAFPSPYLLTVPAHLGVDATTVRRLVQDLDRWQAGLIRLLPAGGSRDRTVDLWRTAALSRAARVRREGEPLADAVSDVYGVRWVSGTDFDVADLSALPVAELRSPPARHANVPGRPAPVATASTLDGTLSNGAVPVAGLRSLLRATRYVARLASRRLRHRLADRLRRPGR